MLPKKVTYVFKIDFEYQKKIILFNPLFKKRKEKLLLYVDSIISESISECSFIVSKKEQAIEDIFKKIKNDCFILIKPEEIVTISDDYKFDISEYLLVKNENKNSLKVSFKKEKRIFNRKDYLKNDFKEKKTDILIQNFNSTFINLVKQKSNYYLKKLNNKISVKELVFLLENGFISNEVFLSKAKELFTLKNKKEDLAYLMTLVADFLINSNEFNLAKNLLDSTIKLINNNLLANFLMAKLYYLKNDNNNSIYYFNNCLYLLDKNKINYLIQTKTIQISCLSNFYLGKIFLRLNDIDQARVKFENSLVINSSFIDSKKELDKIEMNTLENKQELLFSCRQSGSCCKYFKAVNITHIDVARILKNKPELNIKDFIEFINNEEIKAQEFFKLPNGEKKIMALKKKSNSMECKFLEDNKCSIHDFKPSVCRVWPFTLRNEDSKVVWSQSHRLFLREYCKYEFGNSPDQNLEKNIHDFQKRYDSYLSIINQWHKKIEGQSNSFDEFDFIKFSIGESNFNKPESELLFDQQLSKSISNYFNNYALMKKEKDLNICTFYLYLSNNDIIKLLNNYVYEKIFSDINLSINHISNLPYYSFYFSLKNTKFNLTIYPLSKLNLPLSDKIEVLLNLTSFDISIKSEEEVKVIELNALNKDFENKFKESQALLLSENFLELENKINYFKYNLISKILYLINHKSFNIFDLAILTDKSQMFLNFLLEEKTHFNKNKANYHKILEYCKIIFYENYNHYKKELI